MEPNDTQPGGSSGRTITLHLTRDTLVLIAALLFLGIAILLAVVFPSTSPPSTPTSVGAAPTDSPGATTLATAAVRDNTPTATSRPVQLTATLMPTVAEGGYPAPTVGETDPNLTPQALNTTPAGPLDEQQLTTTPNSSLEASPTEIPAFVPTRVVQPADASGAAQSPYPAPATTAPVGATAAAPQQPRATATPTEEPLFQDTPAANPTPQLPPTPPLPTSPPPTPTTRPAPTARPRPPTATLAPTAVPVDVLRGTVRWTASQSPIMLRRDQQLVPGATLLIEPGVEVRLAPGVSFFVEGTLYALGRADQPIRFVGSTPQRWEGLFGREGSNIVLEHTDVRGGGAGGTVLTSEGGNLVLHNAHVNDNGGHILVNGSRLEMRDSEIAGNDMPYGSALEANYSAGGFVILTNNRIGGNRMQNNVAPVQISNTGAADTLNLDIQGNLLVGQDGPDMMLSANGPLAGGLTCNALIGGTNGLSVRSDLPQVPGFALNIRDNATELHTPPIIPEYLTYGIGRGATSEIALDMRNNWWGNPLGPYEPDRHADGRGEAVGDNIDFGPWLTARPACAPKQ